MTTQGEQTNDAVRPFDAHGVNLRRTVGRERVGDCPMCGKRDHFFVHAERGTYECKVCGESGNAITFLGWIAKAAAASTTRERLLQLSAHRGIPTGVLRDGSVGFRDGEWLIPCFSETGTVRDIRRYDGKKLMCTAGCKNQLWGADRLAASGENATVLLLEGEWDGLAARWLARDAGEDMVCVAVPGATTFKPEWAKLFAGKRVLTVYDNDDAGDRGQIKAEKALRGVASELKHVCWPETQPEGYDMRDFARERVNAVGALRALRELTSLAKDSPRREVGDGTGGHPGSAASTKIDESKLPDASLEEVHAAFSERLDMNVETMDAVDVLLAVALSNDVHDDPVWLYLMGAAGVGKTELLSSLAGSSRAVFRSTVTPKCLVSGFKGDGEKDPSLIPRLKGKTLVAKDFTEVLSLPDVQQKEIYSTLRGAFDGYVDKTFGNGAERHYRDCKFSVVAGVTTAILKHRESAMGERFLKYRMSRLSDESARTRASRSLQNLGKKRQRGEELQKIVAAFLKRKLPDDGLPDFDERQSDALIDLAEFVSKMRVQVERDVRTDAVQYKPEQEGLDRVAKQLGTIAKVLAWMHDADGVTEREMRVVRKIAFDTVCGFDSDIVETIMAMGGAATRKDIAESCGIPLTTIVRRMDDLVMVGIVTTTQSSGKASGGRPAVTYVVGEAVSSLWRKMKKGSDQWNEETEPSRDGRSGSTQRSMPRSGGLEVGSRRPGSARSTSSGGSTPQPSPSGSAKRRLVRARPTAS